jgi:hypothetical protein
MKNISTIAILVLCAGFANAQTPDCARLSHSMLETSGFALALDDFARTANSDEFMQQLPGVAQGDSNFVTIFKPIVAKEFASDPMKKAVEARLQAKCKPAQMSQALAKLHDPFIARMLAIEAEATTPAGKEKIQKYAKMYQIAPPTEDRLDLANALDQSSSLTDFTVDSIVAVMRGMLSGSMGDADLAQQLSEYRTAMRPQVQTGLQISLLATYHGVSKADLQQYAKELNSEPLKTVYSQMRQSMLEVFEERAHAVGEDLRAQAPAKSD